MSCVPGPMLSLEALEQLRPVPAELTTVWGLECTLEKAPREQ